MITQIKALMYHVHKLLLGLLVNVQKTTLTSGPNKSIKVTLLAFELKYLVPVLLSGLRENPR